ncbi:DUF2892 domain-containing protein [Sulfurovum sp.]|uniref:YgaP family membrane protein n=1 Tax=Sulfurovum sp. TaxID=1969726 RepID=UPI002867FC68|nr:DUF2892 domain-containing protein [Sulfurovum sp.]
MNINKIRSVCRPIRIVVGLGLIAYGLFSTSPLFNETIETWSWSWFYLGVIPLVAGLSNFCPLCIITKKCDIETK